MEKVHETYWWQKDLINFLLRDRSTNERHIPVLEGEDRYMTIRDQAYCISSHQGILFCSHVLEMSSLQEEADAKMFLCAPFAASLGFQSVEIITVNSDVAILSLYFQAFLADFNIYLQMGSGTKVELLISNQILWMMILLCLFQESIHYQDTGQQVQ